MNTVKATYIHVPHCGACPFYAGQMCRADQFLVGPKAFIPVRFWESRDKTRPADCPLVRVGKVTIKPAKVTP